MGERRMIDRTKQLLLLLSLLCMAIAAKAQSKEQDIMGKKNSDSQLALYPKPMTVVGTGVMCAKEEMQADGIVRLSRIEVYPEYLKEYMAFAKEVGEVSLRTEPGVLTMYAVSEKENPCIITILETYASQEAYKRHIASTHFQKYKQGTLKMVKDLKLTDQTPLNPKNVIKNYME